jgi:hypothetical protein
MLGLMSRFWRMAFVVQYRLLALIDPLVRAWWRRFGLGNVVELRVARRNGRGSRSRLVGLLRVDDALYLGHPNGPVGWTRDLEAAGEAVLIRPRDEEFAITARRLAVGDEREAAIRATNQHPFPGNLVYRLGRRHVRNVGVFFRVTTRAGNG